MHLEQVCMLYRRWCLVRIVLSRCIRPNNAPISESLLALTDQVGAILDIINEATKSTKTPTTLTFRGTHHDKQPISNL